ncbi:2-oxoacid:acceptor oxidoreductase, alpha subunit [Thermanaerovibrio velox DSM 12556]|uniref:2-oxoacid:acceptor oxidoreductase, alpha subunit n=1 Tax=Thermanaerovibrio velox DSM 12556 TaxID=926567 RepID=H0USL9_9BACT|nr:2-oxoacid:acceptor oxidoreductase subunit alpha [Thermanaerovibrio velox]EHM10308.1 2-oxoacid:acceptor oxidoreductase, alpha subunit [Thermanaerovibrio velox DSM 12556]
MSVSLPRDGSQELSIVICGAAGQGLQTVEAIGAKMFKRHGLHVFATKEFMSRVRGGSNSSQFRISEFPVGALADRIDLLICMNKGIRDNIRERIGEYTLVLADPDEMADEAASLGGTFIPLPLLALSRSAGSPSLISSVVLGLMGAIVGVPEDLLVREVRSRFSSKGQAILDGNLKGALAGYQEGLGLKDRLGIVISLTPHEELAERLLLSGNDGVFLGALAGGCDFVTAYPMSPGTGVLQLMAAHGRKFGVIVEQAEDEICAANMVLGAWYAGGRAMTTTSGGGFALMCEAVSLSGVTEVPMVVHIGQRPGPATGMATRTEQGDLNLALYAGHGEFPRAIFTPGDPVEAFLCTQQAFYVADRYQVPAFILTDQYLLDSSWSVTPFRVDSVLSNHVVVTSGEYARYEITEDGVSPRGVPGLGDGLVCVDSHEHDRTGHMKEDFKLRVRMVDKRLKKAEGLKSCAMPPVVSGDLEADVAVIGWGSTKWIVEEAIRRLGGGITQVHLPQVWPLRVEELRGLLGGKRLIVLEGNATGQLDGILKLHGFVTHRRISHYSGLQMSVEQAEASIGEAIGR